MADHLHEYESALQREWREKVLTLRHRMKDRVIQPDEAWREAENLEAHYRMESVTPNPDILNAYLQLARNVTSARELIRRFGHSTRPNTTSYNILIGLSRDKEEAASLFDEILYAGLSPNTYTLNGFIPFCKTLEEARETIRTMHRFQVRPNTQTYNALIAMATGTREARQVLKEMQEHHLDANAVTMNSLITAADDFADAWQFYREQAASGIGPNINTLVSLLKKASKPRDIKLVEQERLDRKIPANGAWTRHLREKGKALG